MKKQFQSKSVPRGTRTIWRYLGALFILFTFAIGNMWAAEITYTLTNTACLAEGTYVTGTSSDMIKKVPVTITDADGNNALTLNCVIYNNKKTRSIARDGSKGLKFDRPGAIYVTFANNVKSISIKVNQGGKFGPAKSADTYAGISDDSYSNLLSVDGDPLLTLASNTEATYNTTELSAGTYKIVSSQDLSGSSSWGLVTLKVEYATSSGPVDPTASFSNSDYTIGGTLDLSTLFTSNSEGAVTYTITDAGDTGASLDSDGKTFSATAVGTATVKASQAATSAHKAVEKTATITVKAAVSPVCPSGLSISGTKDYTAGQTISLEAALEAGNGEITYNWYKGEDLATAKAAGSIGTGTSFSKASCATSDAGNYFCVATKATCSDAESAAYAVTVAAAVDPWIIKVALSGTSGATKTMSGTIGGTPAVNGLGSSSPYKLSNDGTSFVALTLATGNFYPGDSVVLDISKTAQIFYGVPSTSQTVDAITPKLLGTTSGSGPRYFILPNTLPANTNTIFVGRTSSTYNGTLTYMAVYRTPICPSGLTISGEKDYVPGDKIELTASLAKGNGEISYQWYKGSVAAGNEIEGATSAKLEIADCVAGDAGDYFCVASKAACDDAVNSSAYTITVNAFVPVTTITISPASPTVEAKSKITLAAEVLPADATEKTIAWSVKSGSEAYASVNATTGEVTGKAEGNAVIVATATDGSGVFAEKTVVVTPFVCPTSGTIYSFVSDGTKAPGSNTYCPASGVKGVVDIAAYATVSGGLAQGVHTTTSNNPIQIQTSTSAVKLSHADGYFRALLECPLQEGDTIKFEKTNKVKMAFDSLRTKVVEIASGTGANKDYYIVPATYAGEDTIMVYYGGSSVNLTALRVIRPAKYAVTFNMQDHGTQVEPQNILEGGKVEEPATTDITGWDFGGWFTNAACSEGKEWAFATATVSQDTVLYAKWTAHVASNDVALGTLSVNGEAITIVPSQLVYAVELPFGTTAIPTVTATANDENVIAFTITQATAVDGSATIYVKAEDNTTEATYTINFSVATSKDIELVWDKSKERCDATKPDANVLIAAMSEYLSASYTGSAAEGGSLTTGKTTGSKIIITAKPGYAFKAMGFYGKIEDGTCNFYNDGVVETIGTSTGDACYANVFSNDEVHEFVIELTGSNGVYIRNMQLTIIKACTPITIAWDEEPVEFEVGKSGYAIAATASNGGTVSYSTTASEVVDVVAATGALTISGLGSATLKAATAEGDGTTYCANGGNDIEISKAVNTYYLVKFDAQNGDAADEVKYYDGDAAIALPAAPTFAGYDFQGWFDAETGGNEITSAITPAASMTVYAQWVAQCAGATIDVQPTGASYLTGRTATALVCEATAGNGGALTYEWFTCDDAMKTNPVAATAMPSTAVAGTFYYFCKVTEEGCAVEAFSDVVTITVADKDAICIIKSIPTSGTEATVDGVYQGNAYFKGRAADKKLNSQYDYVGVELASGYTFLATDKVVLNQTAALGTGDLSKFYVYVEEPAGGKAYATVLNASPVQGDNWFAMPTENVGQSTLYVGRVDANCNPSVGYLAVYRACAPILSKITVNSVEGTPDNTNHVTIEVPASTTQSQLEAIAFDWVSNDDAWTAAHAPVAANAWEFGIENTVTFTDKDGDASEYYITVNKAAASSDATLSALTVNGQAVALADGVYAYDVELPYGTTVAPTVVATAHHAGAVATVDPCTLSGATITVVPEVGESAKQVYTLTFTISAWKEVVIWDGSYMDDLATSPGALGMAWEVNEFGSIGSYTTTCGEKSYSKYLPSGGASTGRYMTLTVPAGYVAKFYIVMATHSDTKERGMFIGSNLVKDPDETSVLELSNNDRDVAVAGMSEIVGAGTWYINPNNSIDFQEIRAYLRKGYKRTVSNNIGTLCVDHNVAAEDLFGATFYQIAGIEPEYGKIVFDEVTELEAGEPYIFQSGTGSILMYYGATEVANPVAVNGMIGSFGDATLPITEENKTSIMYIAQNKLWNCEDLVGVGLQVVANRCYIDYSQVGNLSSPNPAPGRKRVVIGGANMPSVATGMENVQGKEVQTTKVLINGQLFIIRGEKMYDAKGQLVK